MPVLTKLLATLLGSILIGGWVVVLIGLFMDGVLAKPASWCVIMFSVYCAVLLVLMNFLVQG